MKKYIRGIIAIVLVGLAGLVGFFLLESKVAQETGESGKSECDVRTEKCAKDSENFSPEPECDSPSCLDPIAEVRQATGLSLESLFDMQFDGRDFSVGRVLEQHPAYTRYYITYRSGKLTISGIMNVPVGPGPFPVLLLNHGYIDPSIYTNGRGLRREQDYLARQGFIVLHPDYRNHAESSRTDEGVLRERIGYVEDVINAVYAIRASDLPYFDKENIGMLGHSMGGGIAQTVAVAQPDLVKAIALYAPVSMDYRDSYETYMARDPERMQGLMRLYGSLLDSSPLWDSLSPKTYADRIEVPIILFQGTRDQSVPKEWSDKTAELLRSKGKNLEYIVYDGEAHEFGPRFGDFMDSTTKFFRRHLVRP